MEDLSSLKWVIVIAVTLVVTVLVVIGGRRVVVGVGGAGKDVDLISIASHVFFLILGHEILLLSSLSSNHLVNP